MFPLGVHVLTLSEEVLALHHEEGAHLSLPVEATLGTVIETETVMSGPSQVPFVGMTTELIGLVETKELQLSAEIGHMLVVTAQLHLLGLVETPKRT